MATALILLCAGGTRSSRIGAFPAPEESLDSASAAAAARCVLPDRFRGHVLVSPMRAALETSAAMRLNATEAVILADVDLGGWAGRSFEDVSNQTPDAFTRWLADPTAGAPGGEPMQAAKQRIGQWLDRVSGADRPVCAITHATVIRAALAHALDIPLASTLAIDIMPLSRAELSFNRRWRLQSLGVVD